MLHHKASVNGYLTYHTGQILEKIMIMKTPKSLTSAARNYILLIGEQIQKFGLPGLLMFVVFLFCPIYLWAIRE